MIRPILLPVMHSVTHKRAALFIACALLLALGDASFAKANDKNRKAFHNGSGSSVSVDNFGKVTDFFYRGAQPERDEYDQLAALGIKTVIDLRHDPKSYAQSAATQAGMKYINFPLSDKDYPAVDAPTKFLALALNQENWPIYIHCAGGRHRTGIMTAVFRMTQQGWDIDRAYEEMKDYDFYTRWGHKPMKTFIFDFYRDLQQRQRETQIDAATDNAAAPITRARRVSDAELRQ